jgi:predicted O-methyltransferase YrrM
MKGKTKLRVLVVVLVLVLGCGLAGRSGFSQEPSSNQSTDEKVRSFLDGQRYKWRDENIREADGKVLYDLILKHNYKKALEIGTSTGHSGTWIAWALSKTGGKLITIEIDESRHKKALENFMKAGLSDYVDARLADAHELVPELAGPFDFIFVDADKEWYTNYLKLLLPKLEVGGCFTAHNVRNLEYMHGLKEFLGYVRSLPNMDTTIDTSSGSGISISYKRPEK